MPCGHVGNGLSAAPASGRQRRGERERILVTTKGVVRVVCWTDDPHVGTVQRVGDENSFSEAPTEDDRDCFIVVSLVLFIVLVGFVSGITRHLACSDGAPLELRGQSDLAAQQDVGNPLQTVSTQATTVKDRAQTRQEVEREC